MSGDTDTRFARVLDAVLAYGECGLTEAEWDAALKVAPELARALADAGAGLRAARWDALERLLALLPPGGGTVDERFNRLQPPGPMVQGAPVTPAQRDWLLAAVAGIQVGWTFTAPSGLDARP